MQFGARARYGRWETTGFTCSQSGKPSARSSSQRLTRCNGMKQLSSALSVLAPSPLTLCHDYMHVEPQSRRSRSPPTDSGGGGGGGGGGGAIPGADDRGGFAAALLSSPRVTALLATPPGELRKLLDAAGVPQDPAHTGAELRVKCAAAAWAAEKRRLATDIQALNGGTQARLLSAFEVPLAWKPDARIQAAVTFLQGCRDSAWAYDPNLSFGLVDPARSQIFRLQESVTGGSQQAPFDLDKSLYAQDKVEVTASLA